jgi:transcriptional regulator with XRE-family HTH domain
MNRLKELREQRGWKQPELADRSGLKLGTLQKYEQNAVDLGKASADTVIKLADVFEVSEKYLLGYSDKRQVVFK